MKQFPILISLILYVLSLFSPAFLFIRSFPSSGSSTVSPQVMNGFSILLMGWIGCFFNQFGWFANPLYGLSLYLLWQRRSQAAAVSSAGAIIIAAINTLLLFGQTLPADEAGVGKLTLHHLERGYYFWALALLIPLVASIILGWRSRLRLPLN